MSLWLPLVQFQAIHSHSAQLDSEMSTVETGQAERQPQELPSKGDAAFSASNLKSAPFPSEVGYGYIKLRDLSNHQIVAEDDAPVPTMVAMINRIGEAVRTCRFILAMALGELALYVAPGGSELKRYLSALLKECPDD